jgi:hypothetical protein
MTTARRPGPRIPGVAHRRHPDASLPTAPPPSAAPNPEATPAPRLGSPEADSTAKTRAERDADAQAQPTPAEGHEAAKLPPAERTSPEQGATRRANRQTGPVAVDAVDMTGARTQQFNAYVHDRVKSHYDRLVFELRGEVQGGTNLSELLRALLEEGPATADDARALVLRSRARHQQT